MIPSVVVNMLAGMKVKLKVPVKKQLMEGYFPSTEQHLVGGEKKTPTKGFIVENDDVGSIVAVENEVAVIYTHKKSAENSVWFFATTGEKTIISIGHVPIHDHSSIVQGGPAFGSYFHDDEAII